MEQEGKLGINAG